MSILSDFQLQHQNDHFLADLQHMIKKVTNLSLPASLSGKSCQSSTVLIFKSAQTKAEGVLYK